MTHPGSVSAPEQATELELERWLAGAVNHEAGGTFKDIRLDAFRIFLGRLPPPPAPCTIGGTKGKGSTVRFIEQALLAHGYTTVAFTSPHVRSVRERWRVDGEPAAIDILIRAARVVAQHEALAEMPLTYFERTAAMAVLLAADRPGCLLLWEVGLGGRLDCANALNCRVAVLTHLSHDHRDVLGPTLWHIAGEKLPIVRAGQPLLIAPQSKEGSDAIIAHVATLALGVPVTWVQRVSPPEPLALPGDHQLDNASTALAAAALLLPASDSAISWRGIARARLAARCQAVSWRGRRLVIDGAHNGPSVAATIAAARQVMTGRFTVVLGVANDKEIDEIAAVLPSDMPVVRCGYHSPRARRAQQWPSNLRSTRWYDDIAEALASTDGDLCITGSLYLAGEALVATDAMELPG